MALFSWFSKNNNKPLKKSVLASNNSFNTSKSIKHVTNHNVRPIAKANPNINDIRPTFTDIDDKTMNKAEGGKSTSVEKHISLEKALFTNI